MPDPPRVYARLSRRLQANCVDVAVAFHTPMAGVTLVAWAGGPLAGPVAALLASTPLWLEPVLVARTGATVGHRLLGLRVVDEDTGEPPGLARSFVRYYAKMACLGPWLSPVIAISARHQGLHDQLCGTVVEVVAPESRSGRLAAYDPAYDALRPSIGARVGTTLGFSLVLLAAVVTAGLLMRAACGAELQCGTVGTIFFEIVFRLWFVLQYAVLWLGPAGRLPGAR